LRQIIAGFALHDPQNPQIIRSDNRCNAMGSTVNRWLIALVLMVPLLVPSILLPTAKPILNPEINNDKVERIGHLLFSVILPGDLGVPEREYECLAQAVYFKARSEPVQGQQAVAEVVLNRINDSRFPDIVCAVVFQNENRRHDCQFSFVCDGRSDRPREKQPWLQARQVAAVVLSGVSGKLTHEATHYHANYVQPGWANRLNRTVQVGQHIFYR
jgi:hypothetical protein